MGGRCLACLIYSPTVRVRGQLGGSTLEGKYVPVPKTTLKDHIDKASAITCLEEDVYGGRFSVLGSICA
jgi:hypothetical protein